MIVKIIFLSVLVVVLGCEGRNKSNIHHENLETGEMRMSEETNESEASLNSVSFHGTSASSRKRIVHAIQDGSSGGKPIIEEVSIDRYSILIVQSFPYSGLPYSHIHAFTGMPDPEKESLSYEEILFVRATDNSRIETSIKETDKGGVLHVRVGELDLSIPVP